MNILKLKERLDNILVDKLNRKKNVENFIYLITTSEELVFLDNDSDWYDLFVGLSTSFNLYESDESIRILDSVQLFGDEKLEILIKEALKKIDKIMKEKEKKSN